MEKPDINNFEQNHPELIVEDLREDVISAKIRQVLKYRGVNKWFRVRRLLIQLKHRWKEDIKNLEEEKKQARELGLWAKYYNLQGRVEALIDSRQQIRALCHSPRDINFPHDKNNFGPLCDLPENFPSRPHKRWFVTH